MPGGFKDLSELHIASVEDGRPEMFRKVLEAAMWRAEREHERLVRGAHRDSDVTNRSLEQFGAFRFADLSEPEPRKYLIRNMVSPGLPTYIYGAAATCKSLVGASSAIAIAHEDIPNFCGFPIERHGPVVIFDSELDVVEINRRVRQLCAGRGVGIPRELYYVSAVGVPPEESFPNLLELCEFVGAISTVIDSAGFAMHGDPESYHHTSQNLRDYIDPLRSNGVAPIVIDHKPHQGDNLFGSVSKTYHGRYIFQVKDLDGESREKGKRNVRLINRKASFEDTGREISLHFEFAPNDGPISVSSSELDPSEQDQEKGAEPKVRLALAPGDKTRKQLLEPTGLSDGYLKSVLAELVRDGLLHKKKSETREALYSLTSPDEERSVGSASEGKDIANLSQVEKNARSKPNGPEEEEERRSQLAGIFDYAHTEESASRCLEWVKSVPEIALDIETYGRVKRDAVLYTKCSVRLISLHHGGVSWFIDCDYVPNELVVSILEALQEKPKYLHNALFDIPRLYRRFGVLLDKNVHDTLLASRVARAGEWEKKKFKIVQRAHSLEDCLRRELGIEIPKDRKLKWGGPLKEEHLEYAMDDVAHLKDLYEALGEVLGEHGVEERYEAISRRLPDFIDATVRGVPLDISTLQPALETLRREKADLESRLNELAPEHPDGSAWVWGNTSKETTPEGKGRNGALRALSLLGIELPDLQDQTLLDHREEHEIVHALYRYRKKANTLSRYSRWITDFYEEGRMYPQPKVAAAVTGRVLYSDPNAQGIDKKKTNEFRRCVRAADGRAIVKGDFAQQELRIAAYYSKDKNMLETFANGEDIYLQTAAKLVGKPVDKDHPARQAAKRATLGFLYGLGTEKYRQNVYKDTGERLTAVAG